MGESLNVFNRRVHLTKVFEQIIFDYPNARDKSQNQDGGQGTEYMEQRIELKEPKILMTDGVL